MTITGDTFVDAAEHLCIAVAELDMGAAVELHTASGPTGLAVDNFAGTPDDLRRWVVTEDAWCTSPLLAELRRQIAVVGPEVYDLGAFLALSRAKGYTGIDVEPVGVPLLGPDGWFGTVIFSAILAPSAAVERQLGALATELSVWCTAHGISRLPEVRELARRQKEVATLAASGRTNPEIADELGISINTRGEDSGFF